MARWPWTILARNRRERLISIVSLVSDDTAMRELSEMRSTDASCGEPALAGDQSS